MTRGDNESCQQLPFAIDTEHCTDSKHLAAFLLRNSRVVDALLVLRHALNANSCDAECWNILGIALHDLGDFSSALRCYRQAIQIRPSCVEFICNSARALNDLNFFNESIECYQQALNLNPKNAQVFNSLGAIFYKKNQYNIALNYYEKALSIKSDYAEAHSNRGNALRALKQFAKAEDAQKIALSLQSNRAEFHANLGTVLQDQGRAEEALAAYSCARNLKPDDSNIISRWLFLSNFTANEKPKQQLIIAQQFGQLVQRHAQAFTNWPHSRDPNRPLRIGFVSGDLCQHPVGYFLLNVLEALHRLANGRLRFYGYTTTALVDVITTRIRACCVDWLTVTALPDVALVERIRSDEIDILIDLAGHTAHNRLSVFAWKPAPIQVSWLGYFATTGLSEIDYLLADPIGVPVTHQHYFTEQIWYLPETRLCFSPPDQAPSVAPLPALKNGYLTFGSFQNPAKLNDRVLQLWAQILKRLPQTRLRLQNQLFDDSASRDHFEQRLCQHGIDLTCLSLYGRIGRDAYFAAYADVDLILDTFPFPGGTTTCEALWMGVPTLTLAGESLLARQGASLMTAAGLADWVVTTENGYLTQAIYWARNPMQLAALRRTLRKQVAFSPLCDAERFAQHLESALRQMWQTWLER